MGLIMVAVVAARVVVAKVEIVSIVRAVLELVDPLAVVTDKGYRGGCIVKD